LEAHDLLADRCPRGTISHVQTDKASMLDDAIEYLKQLQLQVQVSNQMLPLPNNMLLPLLITADRYHMSTIIATCYGMNAR
jgi:hypothetical protein